uniref:Uncharacterized protein n=1 Tax=Aureoumbra lagunensis TaxID=44058 RepID=A0A7S3NJJ0_9STRA
MRAAVRGKADFLYSAAVIATEGMKCVASAIWIFVIDNQSIGSIFCFLKSEWRGTLLLTVPAVLYNFQKTLEYVSLRNLNAATFAVLVQTKLFTTAICAVTFMGRSLRRAQVIALILLVIGCVLAQIDPKSCSTTPISNGEDVTAQNKLIGVIATLSIAFSSGFASVYTEKVIKANDSLSSSERSPDKDSPLPLQQYKNKDSSDIDTDEKVLPNPEESCKKKFGLAYTQIQLAFASLIIEGIWAILTDFHTIQSQGLWYGFGWEAWLAVSMTALGGIAVAAVLKFADAILKGYATAISVVLTGLVSHFLFGTILNIQYALGMINVLASMVIYNSTTLNDRAI